MKNRARPDYRKIYQDIITIKHPEKKEICKVILAKPKLTVLDIIQLNNLIFGTLNKDNFSTNQKHRSYDEFSILEILTFQKRHGYSNMKIAAHFKMSRNTIAGWKKKMIL